METNNARALQLRMRGYMLKRPSSDTTLGRLPDARDLVWRMSGDAMRGPGSIQRTRRRIFYGAEACLRLQGVPIGDLRVRT